MMNVRYIFTLNTFVFDVIHLKVLVFILILYVFECIYIYI
jgi:hypothetical protein